jgi:hypothetical protein
MGVPRVGDVDRALRDGGVEGMGTSSRRSGWGELGMAIDTVKVMVCDFSEECERYMVVLGRTVHLAESGPR